MIRICIAGAMGWVGKALLLAAFDRNDVEIVSAVSPRHAGQNVGLALGQKAGNLHFVGTIAQGLAASPDVLIDYTRPEAAFSHVTAAIEKGIPTVLGTTGLTHSQMDALNAAARSAGIGVVSGNFSLTAALMAHLAAFAAKHIDQFEILDFARSQKRDSPSGTATELALELGLVRKPKLDVALEDNIGPKESRGATISGVQVHSVRLPSYQLAVEVVFGQLAERLVIRHEAIEDAAVYVDGTFLAAQRIAGFKGLVRGMNHILFPPL